MTPTVLLVVMTGTLAAMGGYLVGARRGVASREALRSQQRSLEEEIETLKLEVAEDRGSVRNLEVFRQILAPLVARESLGFELAHLDADPDSRGKGLPILLDRIASKGGFGTVLLTDEVGLPLATTRGAAEVELLAAHSSLLLALVDRIAQSGAPAPMAVLVRDVSNQTVLHRVFRVAEDRYLLTAVAKGTLLAPDALDPGLDVSRTGAARALRPGPRSFPFPGDRLERGCELRAPHVARWVPPAPPPISVPGGRRSEFCEFLPRCWLTPITRSATLDGYEC